MQVTFISGIGSRYFYLIMTVISNDHETIDRMSCVLSFRIQCVIPCTLQFNLDLLNDII